MGRIREKDKLKYGCSLCFVHIGAGPLFSSPDYYGMNKDAVEWTNEVCCCKSSQLRVVHSMPMPEQPHE